MKGLKKILSSILISVLLTANVQITVNASELDRCISNNKKISKMMDSYIKEFSKRYEFNGTILVAKKGKVVFKNAYGMSDYEKNIPNNMNTKFTLASITKQFVATSIMMLQERSKLDVNDPISKYIPDYPNGNNITIQHLLTHTSGISDYLTEEIVLSKESKEPYTVDEIIDLFKNEPVYFEPGQSCRYSNSGYVLLGKIIENISGMSCEKFINDNIFKPLKMKNSGFYLDLKNLKNSALGYKRTETGIEKSLNTVDESLYLSSAYTAGGMYSTCEDLYKWDRGLREGKVVKQETLDEMYTNHMDGIDYGYGVFTTPFHGKKCVSHKGSMTGAETYIYRYLDDDTCIIILSNLTGTGIEEMENSLYSILNEGEYEKPVPFDDVNVPLEVLDSYLGRYEIVPGIEYQVTRENEKLYVQDPGGIKKRIYPYAQNEFYYKPENMQVRFENIQDGKPQDMVVIFAGTENTVKRVN